MRKLIAWWATNTVAANLLMVGIVLAGILGFIAMEREAFPNFKPNQVSIEVTWLGAAPQEIEEQVVVRIENAIDISTASTVTTLLLRKITLASMYRHCLPMIWKAF